MHASSRGEITNFAGEKRKVIGGDCGANCAERAGAAAGALPSPALSSRGRPEPPPRSLPPGWFVPLQLDRPLCVGKGRGCGAVPWDAAHPPRSWMWFSEAHVMGVLQRLSNTFVEVEQIIKKFNLAIIDFF